MYTHVNVAFLLRYLTFCLCRVHLKQLHTPPKQKQNGGDAFWAVSRLDFFFPDIFIPMFSKKKGVVDASWSVGP